MPMPMRNSWRPRRITRQWLERRRGVRASRTQCAHFLVEVGLALEADAGQVRHRDVTVLDAHPVGKAAIGLKQIRVAFVAAEPEACSDVQRHLMAAMGDASTG